MDERKTQVEQGKEPEVKRPDEAIKDLEPDNQDGAAVKGGDMWKWCPATSIA
jgi:hypothetical protein